MKINIEKEVFEKLNGFAVGVVVGRGIDNKVEEKRIAKLILEVENMIKMDFIPEQLTKHQMISPWKSAFFDFEERPKEVHSSVEGLMKKVLAGGSILSKDKVNDLAGYACLKHMIPVIVHDTRKIGDEITVSKARGREHFKPEGGVLKHPAKGEIIVRDKLDVLSRKFGLERGEKTRTRKDTKDVIVFVFGLKPVIEKKLIEVCKDISEMLSSFCGGESKYYILDKDNSEADV